MGLNISVASPLPDEVSLENYNGSWRNKRRVLLSSGTLTGNSVTPQTILFSISTYDYIEIVGIHRIRTSAGYLWIKPSNAAGAYLPTSTGLVLGATNTDCDYNFLVRFPSKMLASSQWTGYGINSASGSVITKNDTIQAITILGVIFGSTAGTFDGKYAIYGCLN